MNPEGQVAGWRGLSSPLPRPDRGFVALLIAPIAERAARDLEFKAQRDEPLLGRELALW